MGGMHTRAVAIAVLGLAGCLAQPSDEASTTRETREATPEAELATVAYTKPDEARPAYDEDTGELQEPMTSDQCWAAYKIGEARCQMMPPNAAMGCFITIRALLAVCLASAG
jgi:hypothetical protein